MSDIEHLKVNKITRRIGGKVGLGVYGQVEPSEQPTEAYGGSGDAPVVDVPDAELREHITEALKAIYDPEIPLNIYDLGLIYGFEIDADKNVEITMTLTAPACPVAGMLVSQVAREVGNVRGVKTSHVTLTWDPPWTKDRMSEEAMLELGLL